MVHSLKTLSQGAPDLPSSSARRYSFCVCSIIVSLVNDGLSKYSLGDVNDPLLQKNCFHLRHNDVH